MDCDVQMLIDYIGGTNTGTEQAPKWGFDGQFIAFAGFVVMKNVVHLSKF
jgi:hypothetical protein